MAEMEIMVDIETLGTRRGDVILEIGAAAFCDGQIAETFSVVLSMQQSVDAGFRTLQSTRDWWQKRGGVPGELLGEGYDNGRQLSAFSSFVLAHQNRDFTAVWSKGAMDLEMLEEYFTRYAIICPWEYYERRELRTALSELGADTRWQGVDHRAEQDAVEQALRLIKARNNRRKA